MPRTTLTVTTSKGPFPASVSAGDLALPLTAADVANGNQFVGTGREVLVVQNADAAPQTITLTSSPDQTNRSQNITAYSITNATFACFWFGNLLGWLQSDGFVYINGANANIKFAVIRLP